MGRPMINIDAEEVRKLASYHCTELEMADFFGVSATTIARRFGDIIAKAKADTRKRIRKAQIDVALKGNAVMLIWLGKQMLNQVEREEVTQTVTQTVFDHRLAVASLTGRPDGNHQPSGNGKNSGDGQTVGKILHGG